MRPITVSHGVARGCTTFNVEGERPACHTTSSTHAATVGIGNHATVYHT